VHPRLDRNALDWLTFLADPGSQMAQPSQAMHWAQAAPLLAAATIHGVLPNVLRRLEKNGDAFDEPIDAKVILEHRGILVQLAGHSLRLEHHGKIVMDALAAAGMRAAIIKGPVFAARLYPDAALRPFSDLDILVDRSARAHARPIMKKLGFRPSLQPSDDAVDHHEDQWILPGASNLLIEVQDDLVHAPSFASRVTVGLDALSEAGDGDPAAATALLFSAAVHGALGHQFERLRFAIDLCQASRGAAGPIDTDRLRRVAVRTRTLLPLVAGLDLVGRLFHEPAAIRMAEQLDRSALRALCRRLWRSEMVLQAQGPARNAGAWRRKLAREIFKRAV